MTTRVWILLILYATACSTSDAPRYSAADSRVIEITTVSVGLLDDGVHSLLVRPYWVSRDSNGDYYIPDVSDRDIKVYDTTGSRRRTIGRAGPGPGEFQYLASAFVVADSLYAFDIAPSTVQVFPKRYSKPARSFSIPREDGIQALRVHSADDSLVLVSLSTQGEHRRDLLELRNYKGRERTSFFNRSKYLRRNEYVRVLSYVHADAHAGLVFAAHQHSDSVFAFDFTGRRVGGGLIDELEQLPTPLGQVERDRPLPRSVDSLLSIIDSTRSLLRLIALRDSTVLMQVTSFDAVGGTDFIYGGTIIAARLTPAGRIRNVGRLQVNAGLLGRDRDGSALLLRYADDTYENYEILRLHLAHNDHND